MTHFALPTIRGTIEQQINQIVRYLTDQAEKLNYNMDNSTPEKIFEQAAAAVTASTSDADSAFHDNRYVALKSLIIKTADEVAKSGDFRSLTLTGDYLAKSEFGEYFEKATVNINGTAYGFTQLYEYSSAIRTDLDSYLTDTSHFIKTGYLDTTGSSPVFGIEVGLLAETFTVTDKKTGETTTIRNTTPHKIRITPGRISLFCSTCKDAAAYIELDKIYFPNANITGGTIDIASGTFKVDNKGAVTATSGLIGGFSINDYYIVTKDTTWGNEGSLLLCPGGSKEEYPKSIGGSKSLSGWVITAGKKFGVTKSGQVYANDVYLTGQINATSGTIGGWNIGKGSLCYPNDHAIYKATSADEKGIQYEVGIKSAMGSVNYNNFYVGQYDSTSKSKEIVFAINNSGRLYATKGSISGWTIDRAPLLNANAIYSTAGNYEIGMQGSDVEGRVAFYVKHKTKGDIFYVKNNGTLFASSADITGKITATSGSFTGSIYASGGTIGGWNLGPTDLYKNDKVIYTQSTNYEVGLKGSSGENDAAFYVKKRSNGDVVFAVQNNGCLTAMNAVIYGTVYASGGTIGGWNLGTTDFYPNDKVLYTQSSTYEVGLKGSSGETNAAFYVKKRSDGEVIFAVQNNGTLTAKNAVIYGDVYASGGTIAGWNIGESSLFGINAIYSIAGNYEIGIQGSNSDSNVAFYVKHKTQGDKFYVKNNGTLFASSADITGKITATSGSFTGSIYASGGTIGGFDIQSYYIVTSSTTWGTDGSLLLCPPGTSTDYPKSIGGSDKRSGWVITAGSKFGVDKDGYMFCSGALVNAALFGGETYFGGNLNIYSHMFTSTETIYAWAYYDSNDNRLSYKTWASVGTISNQTAFYVGVPDWTMRLNGKSVQLKDGTAVTSDARLKTEIQTFSEAHEDFFMMLSPKTYKYIEGTSDRTHFGFIAQEMETAILQSGLTTQDVAAFVSIASDRDGFEGYELSIRYSEIVALNTYMIQKCLNKIKSLEDEIIILKNERNV